MSKEIKFKVWDNWNKKFLDYGEVDIWDLVFAEPKLMEEIYTDGMANECLEFLQDTGIKDKNGVEIYEGDICIFNFGNILKPKRQVELNKDFFDNYYDSNGTEVIGNIYENKELLYKII